MLVCSGAGYEAHQRRPLEPPFHLSGLRRLLVIYTATSSIIALLVDYIEILQNFACVPLNLFHLSELNSKQY
ncbi:hypothetical protein O6P43_020879 [Quillaja saponaria]|uniref:Uncharacterized protein n=1 Tax=Quillaja saponaria TaxID=32244 RepID=A0AAD7LLQ5_QUISA|nr:hypothetical protein O6P43_020879 [Quillaja saponaria]